VSFSGDVRVIQDFTTDSGQLTTALRKLSVQADGCVLLEGVRAALRLLAHSRSYPPPHPAGSS